MAEQANLPSWLNGFLCGLMGKGVLRGRKPVAYLYNGVRLPKLPEWDREMYPYAYIGCNAVYTDEGYSFRVFSERMYYSDKMYGENSVIEALTTSKQVYWIYADGEWGEPHYDEGSVYHVRSPKWCNVDVLYEDGSVYFAASDPIPVYE